RSINRDAVSLDSADRRSPGYAARFDSLSHRAAHAEGLRAARDRLRKRVPRVIAPQAEPRLSFTRATLDSAAHAVGRAVARAPLARRAATLSLAPGAWWIVTLSSDGGVRSVPSTVRISPGRRGARDTVRVILR
ncbi:MAG: hypothetical protein ABJD07_04940, partial [Gemmatimonadaceae bacterium]